MDEKGKPVNLTAAQRTEVQGTLLDPNSPFKFDPAQRVAAMPCIAPCTCGDEKAQPWVQGPRSFPIDATLTVAFPGSTADKVTVTVSWQADRFRVVVGKCREEA